MFPIWAIYPINKAQIAIIDQGRQRQEKPRGDRACENGKEAAFDEECRSPDLQPQKRLDADQDEHDGLLRLRRIAEPAHGLVEIVGYSEGVIEAGKYANRAPLPPIARMQARAGSAGVAISAVETTAPDEIPRRGAPVTRELEIDGGAEAVTQHALSQRAIGMCGETGVIDPDQTITTGKVLSEGARMIEMSLHTRRDAIETMGDDLEVGLSQRAGRQTPNAGDRAGTTRGKRNNLAIE